MNNNKVVIQRINTDVEIELHKPLVLKLNNQATHKIKADISKFLTTLLVEVQFRFIDEFERNIDFYRELQDLNPAVFSEPDFDFEKVSLEGICQYAEVDHTQTLQEFKKVAEMFIATNDNDNEVEHTDGTQRDFIEEKIAAKKFDKFIHLLCESRNECPNLFALYTFLLSLPCTEVKCERDFSCLRYTKTYNRASMGDSLLEDEILLKLNAKFLHDSVDMENIVSRIGAKSQKLRKLLLN